MIQSLRGRSRHKNERKRMMSVPVCAESDNRMSVCLQRAASTMTKDRPMRWSFVINNKVYSVPIDRAICMRYICIIRCKYIAYLNWMVTIMIQDKTFTVTRQYQLYALFYFLFFLGNLLPLVSSIEWFQHISTISFIAFFILVFFSYTVNKTEREDELSKTNYLKASSFVLHASFVAILGILLIMKFLSIPVDIIPSNENLWIAGIWFLLFSRNIVFLIFEKMGQN